MRVDVLVRPVGQRHDLAHRAAEAAALIGVGDLLRPVEECLAQLGVRQLGGELAVGDVNGDNVPDFAVTTNVTPCTHNVLGVKGCGEAGAIGAPPAVINAVLDALRPLGVKDIQMPATSEKVWRAIRDAQAQA